MDGWREGGSGEREREGEEGMNGWMEGERDGWIDRCMGQQDAPHPTIQMPRNEDGM